MRSIRIEDINYAKYDSRIRLEGGLVGGSRPRLVLTHKENKKKYIFKSYLHNTNEIISECLASHIGDILGIPIQHVSIRRLSPQLVRQLKTISDKFPDDWVPVGTLASNIFPKTQEIKYGATIVESPSAKMTLEQIEDYIKTKYYAPEDLLEKFACMIIFDSIIGNMDRHHENWGIVETKKFRQALLIPNAKQIRKERHFTPLYDHGSSLLFELSDNNVTEYLNDISKFERDYILGKSYSFVLSSSGINENIFTIIRQHIESESSWGKRFRKAIAHIQLKCKYLEIAKKIIQMPSKTDELNYSDDRKELVNRSITLRLHKLFSMI